MKTDIAPKQTMFKTAKAVVSCALFGAGEYVGISDVWQHPDGTWWFTINRSERGELRYTVVYPEHHLCEFCL